MSHSMVVVDPPFADNKAKPLATEVHVSGGWLSVASNEASGYSDEVLVRAAGREAVRKHGEALKRLADSQQALKNLTYELACAAIDEARQEARDQGDPSRAPPTPLEQCDEQILRSALARPNTGFGIFVKYVDLPAKAAALTYGLAKTQPCIEGNKRVALILLNAYLRLNGHTLAVGNDEIADMILLAAESQAGVEEDDVVGTLRGWLEGAIAPALEEGP